MSEAKSYNQLCALIHCFAMLARYGKLDVENKELSPKNSSDE